MLLVHALSCDSSYNFAYTRAACTKSNKPQLGENVLEALAPKALDTGAHGWWSYSNLVSSCLVKSCLPAKFSPHSLSQLWAEPENHSAQIRKS